MFKLRLTALMLAIFLAVPAVPSFAQLGAPNASGVSIGHVHLTVRDPDAHNKLWALLGAEVTRAGSLELLKFPGIFVILTKGEPTDGSEGSTVNHFGLMVKNVDDVRAKLAANGLPTVQGLTNSKRWVTMFPDQVKVEFAEEPTLKVPIAGHHLHLSTNEMEPLRTWYVSREDTFRAPLVERRARRVRRDFNFSACSAVSVFKKDSPRAWSPEPAAAATSPRLTSAFHIDVARYATTYVGSAFRRTSTVRLKPDTTYL